MLPIKVIMASIPTSSSPHHSINQAGPWVTNRVLLSCEEGKKPYSASYVRFSQTQNGEGQSSVLLTACPPQIPGPDHSALSRHPSSSHLAAFGQNWPLPHSGDMSSGCCLATFAARHARCPHPGPGSLLRSTLGTAGAVSSRGQGGRPGTRSSAPLLCLPKE